MASQASPTLLCGTSAAKAMSSAKSGGAAGILTGRPALDVACITTPETGHVLPTLNLARGLAARGHMVRFVTCDWISDDMRSAVEDAGAKLVPIECDGGLTQEAMHEREKTTIFSVAYHKDMLAPLCRALAAGGRRPDVIVADFGALAAMDAAQELGVPLIINWPGPLSAFIDLCGVMDTSTHRSFLGVHVGLSSSRMLALARWFNVLHMGEWFDCVERHLKRGALLFINSFWGLDAPQALPPNFVMTGPLLPPASALLAELPKKHPELDAFLSGAAERGVVYVTTGSQAKLYRWQVEELYWGLKQCGRKVVWSLKAPQQEWLPRKDDPDFFVSSWTPQAMLLQHAAVRVVLTHCGWGGTLEVLTAAKPVVVMPFFGDQPSNAKLLVDAGMGVPVGKVPKPGGASRNPYEPGDITAATVGGALRRIFDDYGTFRATAERLAACARATDGLEGVGRHVEWAARLGTERLAPSSLPRAVGSNLPRGLVLMGCAALAAVTAAGFAVTLGRRRR